jgi:hypothetical protein
MRSSRFAGAYESMVARHAPRDGSLIEGVELRVHAAARQWVRDEACTVSRVNTSSIYNTALGLAGLRAFAHRYGFQTQLHGPVHGDRERREVPPWEVFTGRADDFLVKPALFGEQWSAVQWAHTARILPETLLENGILTLGTLATMSEGSGLVAMDGRRFLTSLELAFPIAGADPYPPAAPVA